MIKEFSRAGEMAAYVRQGGWRAQTKNGETRWNDPLNRDAEGILLKEAFDIEAQRRCERNTDAGLINRNRREELQKRHQEEAQRQAQAEARKALGLAAKNRAA